MCYKAYLLTGNSSVNSFQSYREDEKTEGPGARPIPGIGFGVQGTPREDSEPARQLNYQVAGAVQDVELYFNLCSTPLGFGYSTILVAYVG